MVQMAANRRTFMQMAAAGLGLAASSRSAYGAPASDRLQFGFIGLGQQGTSRLNEFMKHPDVAAVAVCDLDQTHLDRAAALVEKARDRSPRSSTTSASCSSGKNWMR